ncbi:PLDc N-terminal domain-containing protein [Gelatiniphilus marinus]|uniref:PLDc N-terminal domain-containing protein n=1 Tax=Gelatiniphilus marinus TaxID=1759464 RepID=A0ABW5JSP4_9FLAO
MLYYLTIALQIFCIYHVFKNRNTYYWIFLILLVPVFGSLIYLFVQVYNREEADKITDEITHIINPTKKIKDLEKQLEFSETYQNRVNLADAFLENRDYKNAIPHYLQAIEGNPQNDFYVIKQLIEAYFNIKDYDNVVLYAEKIKEHPEFKKSRSQFWYGLALEKLGKFEAAETNLRAIDIRFSFYNERLVLAQFLLNQKKEAEAKAILKELQTESQYLTKPNKKLFRATIQDVDKLLTSLSTN